MILEHYSAHADRPILLPPTLFRPFGDSLPKRDVWSAFRRHERSPRIPRIGRAFAAILPDFAATPFY
jgi:hypothetical protein